MENRDLMDIELENLSFSDTDLNEFLYFVGDLTERFLSQKTITVPAKDLRLDSRCGSLQKGEDFICVSKSYQGNLEYYGGFEYISKEYVFVFGDTVIYTKSGEEDCRVSECLSYYDGNVVTKE